MEKLEYTRPENYKDWLEIRRKSIGGSDAAAIVGLNRFSSPYTVWLDKTGRVDPPEDNEAMRQGRDLEEYVAYRFSEATGKKVRRDNRVIHNPKYPFAHANIDRRIVGENAGLECKTTSVLNLKKFEDGEFPENYYIQCLHYMMVTGMEKYYLAVIVMSKDFYWFEIPRNDEMIRDLAETERDFWELVKNDIEPGMDGSEATEGALEMVYPDSNGETIDLFGMDKKAKRLLELREEKKELEAEIKALEQEFKNTLGENETGSSEHFTVSWKNRIRKTFQVKEFQKANPDIDLEPYYKKTKYRAFTLKEV